MCYLSLSNTVAHSKATPCASTIVQLQPFCIQTTLSLHFLHLSPWSPFLVPFTSLKHIVITIRPFHILISLKSYLFFSITCLSVPYLPLTASCLKQSTHLSRHLNNEKSISSACILRIIQVLHIEFHFSSFKQIRPERKLMFLPQNLPQIFRHLPNFKQP